MTRTKGPKRRHVCRPGGDLRRRARPIRASRRVVFRALTEETSLSRAKLVVRQVNRIFEQSEVKLKVPAYKLTGFETAESAAEGLKNQSVSGDWGQVARPK